MFKLNLQKLEARETPSGVSNEPIPPTYPQEPPPSVPPGPEVPPPAPTKPVDPYLPPV